VILCHYSGVLANMEDPDMERDNHEEFEIDIHRLMSALLHKAWLIGLVSIVCAAITLAVTFFFITPKYEATAKFYVNNSASSGGSSVSISSGDLVTSRSLVDSYIVILTTRETMNEVIEQAGVTCTYKEAKQMVSAEAVDETEIIQVTVTSTDPQEAEKLANAIAYVLPYRISSVIEGTSAKVLETAVVPTEPSSPSYPKNTIIGFMLGFVLSIVVVALKEILDTRIRSEEDISRCSDLPILAAIPDMTVSGKGGSYYGYGSERQKMNSPQAAGKYGPKGPILIGGDIGFAASEAYKLLRTKLQFSFADDDGCRVVAVSSSLSGEGKSLTAINLSYALSELGAKVILVDCDMRRPTLAEKLKIRKKPGLSSCLTGQGDLAELVQYCGIAGNEKAFHVIAAGQNPPNPVELLSSARMTMVVETLRKHYDYVILDFPPMGEVSDVLSVANKVDGTLLVVRENHCNRNVLSDTVRQFEFMNAKLLGIVFNGVIETEGKYGKKYYKQYDQNNTPKFHQSTAKKKKKPNSKVKVR